jgi:hypothetical protein
LPFRVIEPQNTARAVYDQLHALFRDLYFGFGGVGKPPELGHVLGNLRHLAQVAKAP